MGADLYINSIHDKAREKYLPLFNEAVAKRDRTKSEKQKEKYHKMVKKYYELLYSDNGYFRDSYNGTCLLQTLGLSWWSDISPLCNEKGELFENLKKFRVLVANAEMIEITKEYLKNNNCQVDKENTIKAWQKYFVEKRENLLAFIDKAIELGEPIDASL